MSNWSESTKACSHSVTSGNGFALPYRSLRCHAPRGSRSTARRAQSAAAEFISKSGSDSGTPWFSGIQVASEIRKTTSAGAAFHNEFAGRGSRKRPLFHSNLSTIGSWGERARGQLRATAPSHFSTTARRFYMTNVEGLFIQLNTAIFKPCRHSSHKVSLDSSNSCSMTLLVANFAGRT